MRWTLFLIVTSAIFGLLVLPDLTSSAPRPNPQIAKLQREIDDLNRHVKYIDWLEVQLEVKFQNAAEAESNLEARVSALEAKVGK